MDRDRQAYTNIIVDVNTKYVVISMLKRHCTLYVLHTNKE